MQTFREWLREKELNEANGKEVKLNEIVDSIDSKN